VGGPPVVEVSGGGPRRRVQGGRKSPPAPTRQRNARASCYGVCFEFGPRGRDTYSARRPQRPSRSHLGCQSHQTLVGDCLMGETHGRVRNSSRNVWSRRAHKASVPVNAGSCLVLFGRSFVVFDDITILAMTVPALSAAPHTLD